MSAWKRIIYRLVSQPRSATMDTRNRGKELPAALENEYRRLRKSHQLSGGLHGTDVTGTVLPFISVGMEFDEAELILEDAGFTVAPRPGLIPPPEANRAKDWYAVLARISPFDTGLLQKISLYVTLLPKAPGDYSTIKVVSAKIFISMP